MNSCFRSIFVLTLALLFSISLLSCNGGSSDPRVAEVRSALVNALGEEGALDAVLRGFVRGYSLQQIVDAALEGRIDAEGVVVDGAGAVEAPLETPVGELVAERFARRETQVLIETRFITISDDFFEGIGADFDLSPIDVPLTLREEGYSSGQIVNLQEDEKSVAAGVPTFPLQVLNQAAENVLPLLGRSGVLQLVLQTTSGETFPPQTGGGGNIGDDDDDLIGDDDDDSNNNSDDQSLLNSALIVSPTTIAFDHVEDESPCPYRVGTFSVINSGAIPLAIDIGQTNGTLSVSRTSFQIPAFHSGNVDIDYNCEATVPFLAEIPLVGRLFRNGAVSSAKKELIILVQANIVLSE